MHVFLLFFAWPGGGAWSNVIAMPLCGVLAGLAAFLFRDRLGRALKRWHGRHFGHHAQLDEISARLDAHADLLDTGTPGGLAAVMAELRGARTAAESAHEAVKALGVIAGSAKAPRRGATEMRPAGGAASPDPMAAGGPGTSGRKSATGTGPKVTPKSDGKKM